jgi:hypothetical protein
LRAQTLSEKPLSINHGNYLRVQIMSILTSSERQTYQENGVVVLRQVFSDWIDTLRAGVDYNFT